jgi:hypothetical protein
MEKNKKQFSALSLDEQVDFLLWSNKNSVNINIFYRTFLSDFLEPIDYMEKQGLIGFNGNTIKDMVVYLTEKGLERIKNYAPPKINGDSSPNI